MRPICKKGDSVQEPSGNLHKSGHLRDGVVVGLGAFCWEESGWGLARAAGTGDLTSSIKVLKMTPLTQGGSGTEPEPQPEPSEPFNTLS